MTSPTPTDSTSIDLDTPLAPEVPAAPHSASGEQVPTRDLEDLAPPPRPARRWTPKRVVITPAALDHPHGLRIVERVEAAGIEAEEAEGGFLARDPWEIAVVFVARDALTA